MYSSLAEKLREVITSQGPITFRDWMQAALYDQEFGYYSRSSKKKVWGREGDYRTSPERSRLFSATFARFFTRLYDRLNRPATWTIVECGAGAGDFATGVLDTLHERSPILFEHTRYVIDEPGYSHQELKQKLASFPNVTFGALNQVQIEGVIFANELLDAFPVHRVTQLNGELFELYVDMDAAGAFIWRPRALVDFHLEEYLRSQNISLRDGQIIDISLAVSDWLKVAAASLNRGFVILVDYGAEAPDLHSRDRMAGTLRAFQSHSFVADFLQRPGECDLTTTVNWTYVRHSAETAGLKVESFQTQDKFLLDHGFADELEHHLRAARDEAERSALAVEAREMILPQGMSQSFQVLVLTRGA